MLYIVRVFEDNETFDYEYGNMDHALEQYANEIAAYVLEYQDGEEKVVRRKVDGKEVGARLDE